MKLDFEIAVDHDRTGRGSLIFANANVSLLVHLGNIGKNELLTGVPDSRCPLMPAGQPRLYLVNFWLNFAKSLNMLKIMLWGALLVATSLLNACPNMVI